MPSVLSKRGLAPAKTYDKKTLHLSRLPSRKYNEAIV